jgi:hypothetical protein
LSSRQLLENDRATDSWSDCTFVDDSLFGVVEYDIKVPDHLKDKFSEMWPIFKNTEISRDDIGEYMKAYAEEHNIMPQSHRSLIGSYFGEKILLATPLIKWYLEHGLAVTKIYQVIEHSPILLQDAWICSI